MTLERKAAKSGESQYKYTERSVKEVKKTAIILFTYILGPASVQKAITACSVY